MPHGDFAYDPSLVDFRNGSYELHLAAKKLGTDISNLSPDIVVLVSPHGVAATNDFLVYQNSVAEGFAILGQFSGSQTITRNPALTPSLTLVLTVTLALIFTPSP